MTSANYHQHPAWNIVERALYREWRMAVSLVAGSTALVVLVASWMGGVWLVAGVVGLIAASAALHYLFGRGHYRQSGLWRALRENPREASWIYAVSVQRMPLGIYMSEQVRITVAFTNGQRHEFQVAFDEFRTIWRLLERICTEARFGWRAEWEGEFRRQSGQQRRNQGSDAR